MLRPKQARRSPVPARRQRQPYTFLVPRRNRKIADTVRGMEMDDPTRLVPAPRPMPLFPTNGGMSSNGGVGAVEFAGTLEQYFEALVATLTLHPAVKYHLAAGTSHARTAKVLGIRKASVSEIAQTPFRPLDAAYGLAVDPWTLGRQLWRGTGNLVEAVGHVLEWDAKELADSAAVTEHAEQYGITSLSDELLAYQGTYARVHLAGAASWEDQRYLPTAERRVILAGGTEHDLSSARNEVTNLLETPVVPEVPNRLHDAVRRYHRASRGKPWEAQLFQKRHDRETFEHTLYGRLRPTTPDASTDPRVLARDVLLYNYGDARVCVDPEVNDAPDGPHNTWGNREKVLRDFAETLGVRWDKYQTFSPEQRDPEEVADEITAALKDYQSKTP